MKFVKNILLTIFTAFFAFVLVFGGYSLYAEEIGYSSFTVEQAKYHIAMNDYFNEKLERVVSLLNDEKFFEHPDFLVPSSSEECLKTNVSTYCVSMGALDLYIKYVQTLLGFQGSIVLSPDSQTISDVFNATTVRNEDISDEIDNAKIVMKATIAAYDEFKMAYPMHKKYQSIIFNLTKYKLALKKIRNQVADFPQRFVDSSSSQCK